MWVGRPSVRVLGGQPAARLAPVSHPWLFAPTARRGGGAEETASGEEQGRGGPMPEQEEGADGVFAAGEGAVARVGPGLVL